MKPKPHQYLCRACRKWNHVSTELLIDEKYNARCNYCGKPLLEVMQLRHRFENGAPMGELKTTKETYRKLLETGSE